MQVNDPEVIAELSEHYPRYETALVTNDVDTLIAMFWNAADVVRFGVTENLHGIEEIQAFRKGRSPVNLARKIERLDIVSFGRDFGCVTLEFSRENNGETIYGRQSQTWVRMPEGWRIVSAHVSLLPVSAKRSA
ncbi:MAG TPA: oxalurate catabolism protein HpxZ [Acidobacteriaceae bacterium]|nr:oxalurate catabolism protein HpxZ [Acidobacteriaceae bacterium]